MKRYSKEFKSEAVRLSDEIGVKKAADGSYYWTVDDEWMTDDDGAKIPAVVTDSGDSRYITPQFRIADSIWYISYDNGNSWREVEIVNEALA